MMSERMALKIAIDLMHVPSQVRLFRSEPLPDGVEMLLRIAASDEEAAQIAMELTGRSREVVSSAATFFVEQILFAPNADSYRVLGTGPQAGGAELRRNLALLLRWLHPDLDPRGARSVFIGRVTAAWNNLKTPERRSAYDASQRRSNDRSRSRSGRRDGHKRVAGGLHDRNGRGRDMLSMYGTEKVGFFRRALSVLFHRPPQ
jgi:hypothetical protein